MAFPDEVQNRAASLRLIRRRPVFFNILQIKPIMVSATSTQHATARGPRAFFQSTAATVWLMAAILLFAAGSWIFLSTEA